MTCCDWPRAYCVATLLLGLFSSSASAMGPQSPAEVVPLPEHAFVSGFDLPGYSVTINSPTTLDIELRSTLYAPDGTVISDPGPVSASPLVDGKAPSFDDDAPKVIDIDTAHLLTLKAGLYSEFILASVTDDDYDFPVTRNSLRFFEVTPEGIQFISSTEFTTRTRATIAGVDRNGELQLHYVATTRNERVDAADATGFDVPVKDNPR